MFLRASRIQLETSFEKVLSVSTTSNASEKNPVWYQNWAGGTLEWQGWIRSIISGAHPTSGYKTHHVNFASNWDLGQYSGGGLCPIEDHGKTAHCQEAEKDTVCNQGKCVKPANCLTPVISCIAETCKSTGNIANSDKTEAGSITGKTKESVTVTCNAGYSGTGATVCQPNGEFSALQCVKCEFGKYNDAPNQPLCKDNCVAGSTFFIGCPRPYEIFFW